MKKTKEKRQFFLHVLDFVSVPSEDTEFLLKWKRGDRDCNKGTMDKINCKDQTINLRDKTFEMITVSCTLIKTAKGYQRKEMKFTLFANNSKNKKKMKFVAFATGSLNLSYFVDLLTAKVVKFDMVTKNGKTFEGSVDIQCIGSDDKMDNDTTDVVSKSINDTRISSTNPFDDESDIDISVDSKQPTNPFADSDNELPQHQKQKSNNPFDDSDDELLQHQKQKSNNPFDDSDDELPQKQKKKSNNPFDDLDDSPKQPKKQKTLISVHENSRTPQSKTLKTSTTKTQLSSQKINSVSSPNIRKKKEVNLIAYEEPIESESESSEEKYTNPAPAQSFFGSSRSKTIADFAEEAEYIEPIVKFSKPDGFIDLREVFDSASELKGNLNETESFVVLLKKWWGDGNCHIELEVLPLHMETFEECIWLLLCLRDVGGRLHKGGEKKLARDQQIEDMYEKTFVKVTRMMSLEIGGLLTQLVSITFFDSKRSRFEEGVASATTKILLEKYEILSKYDLKLGNRITLQIIHFINYYIIEEILAQKRICGMKGFQINYFLSCVFDIINSQSLSLKKYIKYFAPLNEVCRLLSMPITLDIIKSKDDIFPSLPSALIHKLLRDFRLDSFNLQRISSSVLNWIFEHSDGKPIPSRFDVIQ
ncbi:C2 NT-type domain-containing protein [Entamoeba marina]